jgi:hydroxyacylglutathione hydrolase
MRKGRRNILSSDTIQRRSIRKGSLRIEALVVPPLSNNVYILYEDGSNDAVIVDVAQGAKALFQRVKELDLKPILIFNTHGHTDHTAEDGLLRTMTNAKLAIHELDAYRLALDDEASEGLGIKKQPLEPDIQLTNGQEIKFGDRSVLKVVHTPGHTEGSICLYIEKEGQLFSGDTLFQSGYGRVDGFGSDPIAMKISLKKLLELPGSTDVYPGHGGFTTIQSEMWLREITE